MHADARPLIVTLRVDPETFARLDALRQQHFPPERNLLSAHLTLFHALPGDRSGEVVRTVRETSATQPPFVLHISGYRSLGRGVALDVQSPVLLTLRKRIATAFAGVLTPQDAGGFRPHVTIQNKVSAPQARSLLASLVAGFTPWTGQATGLQVWRYCGGPWMPEAAFDFSDGFA